MNLFVFWGALMGFVAVAAGAFGAHALRSRLEPRALEVVEIAVRYQALHALALCVVAWRVSQGAWGAVAAGWCFVAGCLVFSGSLYGLALSGFKWLGAITPIGGVLFLVGWTLLAIGAWRPV